VTPLAVVLSLAAGLAGGVQVAVLGRLGDRVGSFEAFAFSALVTALVGAAALLVLRQSWHGYAAALRQPPWLWIGGLMGAFIVLTITVAGSRIGTTSTVALLITGNLAMAVLIDRFGLFGIRGFGLHWQRIVGIVLLGAGAALALKK
jgi:bacterial/archaeal transporter family-2 protein